MVALLTREDASPRASDWIGAQHAGSLTISPWVSAEVASALSAKMRMGVLTADLRGSVLDAYGLLVARSLIVLPIIAKHFATAARFANEHFLALRAADALHLAIAADRGDTLATLDAGQAKAGQALGVPTLLV